MKRYVGPMLSVGSVFNQHDMLTYIYTAYPYQVSAFLKVTPLIAVRKVAHDDKLKE